MNTIVKILLAGATLATLGVSGMSLVGHNPSQQYEVTRGKITQLQERRINDREKRVLFNIEYITGESRPCNRVVFDGKHMYGDCGALASPNYRSAVNPLPVGKSIDVCCWDGGRMNGRCSFPGDDQYVGCMQEAYKTHK